MAVYGIATPGERSLSDFYGRNATYGSTRRYREATEAEAYNLGLQDEYHGKKPWDDPTAKLSEKSAKIKVPLYAEAINALGSFVWGQGTFPKAIVGATRDDESQGEPGEIGPALQSDDAQKLTRFVAAMVEASDLDRAMREATRKALITTSCALILGCQGGYVIAQSEPGKHCTPTFDPVCPKRLTKLDIIYQHQKEVPNGVGGVRLRWFWYRRTIDTEKDTVYLEEMVVAGRLPEWKVDPDKTVEHGLGFCPVVWLRTLPDSSDPLDGRPVIDPQLYPMLDAVNLTISQRDRAVAYGCEPQGIRKGVDLGQREELRKNPGKVWDLPENGGFEWAEISGEGAIRATEHLNDLTARFHAATRVVAFSPEHLRGDVSGRFLEMIHAPMIALAGDLRSDLGRDGYAELIKLGLRLVATVVERGEDVWIPGAYAAGDLLTRAQLAGPWLDPPVTLAYSKYFSETPAEQQARVTTAQTAVDAGFISKHTATRELADVFHVEDPEAEHELAEQEADEARQRAMDDMAAQASLKDPDGDGDDDTMPKGDTDKDFAGAPAGKSPSKQRVKPRE